MKQIVRAPLAFREMGTLASESVAANFEQREQIRQLENHYDEAIALANAKKKVHQSAPTVVQEQFPERAAAKTL